MPSIAQKIIMTLIDARVNKNEVSYEEIQALAKEMNAKWFDDTDLAFNIELPKEPLMAAIGHHIITVFSNTVDHFGKVKAREITAKKVMTDLSQVNAVLAVVLMTKYVMDSNYREN